MRTSYRPELDGVRAIAIGLVIFNHAAGDAIGWDLARFIGWSGVTMFFVLSGYLITGLLIAEREQTGGIALRSFYERRVARLGPALLCVLAFVALTHWYPGWQVGVLGAMTYTSNWLRVADIDLGPLNHTWSLAVEEQFYLLWPMALILWPRYTRQIACGVIALGIATYAVLGWPTANAATPAAGIAIMLGALASIAGLGSARLRFLAPLAPFGKRAYSYYLWNWPLSLFLGPVGGLLATLPAGELSYRLVERPILRWYRRRPRIARAVPRYGSSAAPVAASD
jgi:peptidoglycan/LPS O-acetylase OafA/YrhL